MTVLSHLLANVKASVKAGGASQGRGTCFLRAVCFGRARTWSRRPAQRRSSVGAPRAHAAGSRIALCGRYTRAPKPVGQACRRRGAAGSACRGSPLWSQGRKGRRHSARHPEPPAQPVGVLVQWQHKQPRRQPSASRRAGCSSVLGGGGPGQSRDSSPGPCLQQGKLGGNGTPAVPGRACVSTAGGRGLPVGGACRWEGPAGGRGLALASMPCGPAISEQLSEWTRDSCDLPGLWLASTVAGAFTLLLYIGSVLSINQCSVIQKL